MAWRLARILEKISFRQSVVTSVDAVMLSRTFPTLSGGVSPTVLNFLANPKIVAAIGMTFRAMCQMFAHLFCILPRFEFFAAYSEGK